MGTHGVGKTSFAHALVAGLNELGLNAGMTREFVRECPIPTGTEKRNSVAAQAWIIGRQLIEEIEASRRFAVLVCDRTVMDNYAYFIWTLKRAPGNERSHDARIAEKIVDEWLHSYDFLFLMPIAETKLTPDGFRSTDPTWQKEIDEIIGQIIEDKRLKVFEIPLAPNAERVKRALSVIAVGKP